MAIISVISTSGQEVKESPLNGYHSVGIFFDQDLLVNEFKLNEDRNYTMGIGFYYASSGLRTSWIAAPVKWLGNTFFPYHLSQSKEDATTGPFLYSLMLGNGSFTPDSLPATYLITNDRPYGSITYFQGDMVRIDEQKLIKYSTSFIVGVLGTPIAKAVQTEIHSWFNDHDTHDPRKPRGWGHQISSPGELTFAISRSTEYLMTKKGYRKQQIPGFGAELKQGWKYMVGYYTLAQYQLSARFGWIDRRNWTQEINPLGSSDRELENKVSYAKRGAEVYFQVALRPVFMLYNALLNGGLQKTEYAVDFQHSRHFVLEEDLALAGSLPIGSKGLLDVRWKIVSGRSPEFKLPGRKGRSHYWGGIDIVYNWYQ